MLKAAVTSPLRQGQSRHPAPLSSSPWSWDSQLYLLKLTPDQQEANCHHLLVFLFSTTKIAEKTSILKCHKCIRKKNAFIYSFFFSVSEIWLSWMSVPKSSVAYEKLSLLFSVCLMMLKEDKLTLDHWKKGKINRQHKYRLHELICQVTLSNAPPLCWTSSMWSCIISLSSHLIKVPFLHRSPRISVKHAAVPLVCQCDLSCSLLMLGLCCC